jgi:hypothetical protein
MPPHYFLLLFFNLSFLPKLKAFEVSRKHNNSVKKLTCEEIIKLKIIKLKSMKRKEKFKPIM